MKKTTKNNIPPFKMTKLRELNGSYYIPVPKAWIDHGIIQQNKGYWIKATEEYSN